MMNFYTSSKPTVITKEKKTIKKCFTTALIYMTLGLASGVFYRTFTMIKGYTGLTSLSVTHTHLLTLGMFMFLIIALFAKDTKLTEEKSFKTFYTLYNIALPFIVVMLYVRGIPQVLNISLASGLDHAISGIAGVAHILLAVAMGFLFKSLKTLSK